MDSQRLKKILEREIEFHTEELNEHIKLADLRKSKTQRRKAVKHFHKRFQTIKIAKALGFTLCEHCWSLK